jgi:hypothetical protein
MVHAEIGHVVIGRVQGFDGRERHAHVGQECHAAGLLMKCQGDPAACAEPLQTSTILPVAPSLPSNS